MRVGYLSRKFAFVKQNALRTFLHISSAFVLLMLFAPVSSWAQFGGHTRTIVCGRTDTVFVGEAYYKGGQNQDTVNVLIDSTFKNDTIRVKYFGDPNFAVFSPDTIVVTNGKRDTLTFTIRYTPTSQGTDTFQIGFTGSNGKCQYQIRLWGVGIDTTPEQTLLPLFTSIPKTVAFTSQEDTSVHYLSLYNNSITAIHIDSMRLVRASAFRIDSPAKYQVTLFPFDTLRVPLIFKPQTKGLYQDYLIVWKPVEPVLQDVIPIQGFYDPPPQSVRISVTHAAHFAVYPNPSHGEIMVHTESLTHARAEIIDMLGRRIEEGSFNSDWQWNRETIGGGTAMSGAYFIVVSGMTESGESVREVETIVLE
jgi:hypothetical protein